MADAPRLPGVPPQHRRRWPAGDDDDDDDDSSSSSSSSLYHVHIAIRGRQPFAIAREALHGQRPQRRERVAARVADAAKFEFELEVGWPLACSLVIGSSPVGWRTCPANRYFLTSLLARRGHPSRVSTIGLVSFWGLKGRSNIVPALIGLSWHSLGWVSFLFFFPWGEGGR